ncbi:hypothetical protein ACWGCI_21850 [Streptomyces sp. NPDC054949]
MSARTVARRTLRTAGSTAVVAAIAGTALMPLSAHAEEGAPRALKTTMSAPVPSGPLARGGATETFDLTVTNPTDKASSYHPWLLLDHTGDIPLQQKDVVYKIAPVDAPATDSRIGQQDGQWQGLFHPAGKSAGDGFLIPAGGKMTWKVTIGLGTSYPTHDGDFTLVAASSAGEISQGNEASLTFKTVPVGKPGKLDASFVNEGPCEGGSAPDCREMDLRLRSTGDGVLGSDLASWLQLDAPGQSDADLRARVKVDGVWKDLKGDGHTFNLPVIPKGFGAASGDRVTRVQIKLGPKTGIKKLTPVTVRASIGLAEDNTYPFLEADRKIELGPKPSPTAPTPTGSTTTTPAPTKPAPGAPKPTGSATTAPAAPATAHTPGTANAPAATGSLAHTGADSDTGLYAGLAGVLVALGGAVAWIGARRRRAARG